MAVIDSCITKSKVKPADLQTKVSELLLQTLAYLICLKWFCDGVV